MKKLLLVLSIISVGCTEERLQVIHNNDRVLELERRAALNDQLNAVQNQRLDLLEAALAAEEAARLAGDLELASDLQAEIDARIAADDVLADLVAQEEAARIAGDLDLANKLALEKAHRIAGDAANSVALAIAMFTQGLTNLSLQGQINTINSKLTVINSKIASLTVRMSNAESDINSLESDLADLRNDMTSADLALQAQLNTLSVQQAATQAQLNQEGVKVFKCNSSSSTERIFKINNKFYAAMNRVTTKTIQVVTGSSSQTFHTPDLCETWNGDLELPNSGGVCTPVSGPFKSTKIPGTTIVVPSYTTASVSVVDSVKIALDTLPVGGYSTTDGGPACSFSITGTGSTSTNLIQVQ